MVNNATSSDLSSLQKVSVILKLANFFDVVLEFLIFGLEMYFLHNLGKSGLDRVGTYNEVERRKRFAKKFMCRTLSWLLLVFIGFVAVQFAVDSKECQDT